MLVATLSEIETLTEIIIALSVALQPLVKQMPVLH